MAIYVGGTERSNRFLQSARSELSIRELRVLFRARAMVLDFPTAKKSGTHEKGHEANDVIFADQPIGLPRPSVTFATLVRVTAPVV
jgi:hypothetical protein